jgi:cytochrome c556
MHESASEFAREAAKTLTGGDLKAALAALARVTQSCAACHAEYRLK